MAYTTINKSTAQFNTKLYTGNGGTNNITGVGFQPDWTWLKKRNGAVNHSIFDAVRGATKNIVSNTTASESTSANGLQSWNSDGFVLGSDGDVNASGGTYVGWNWKAGTSFTNDASATGIGTIDSTGSVNTDAGFSIVSYTGNGSSGATIKHGLSTAPKIIIAKNRQRATNWLVFSSSMSSNGDYTLFLDSTSAKDNSQDYWGDTAPTSSVFSVGNRQENNQSSENIIAYCFAEKQGYSKFGSYTGNGNADGTFVYTGFKPAYVMTKSSATTSNWEIKDNKRLGYNTVDTYIKANASAAEDTGVSSHAMDFLSNGFKHRGNNDEVNGSGEAYIYMAFAESPFTNSGFVPNNAR